MESGRFEEDGVASMSRDVPILCAEWVLIVPDVPEIGGYGSWRSIQHRIVFAVNDFIGAYHRIEGTNWIAF